jgi:hypothetical protein
LAWNSLGAIVAFAIPLFFLIFIAELDHPLLWFIVTLLIVSPILVHLVKRFPDRDLEGRRGLTWMAYKLTMEEGENRVNTYLSKVGAVLGKVPAHEGLAREPSFTRVLEATYEGHPFLMQMGKREEDLIVQVGPVPLPVTGTFDRFMRGLDETLAAQPQKGYTTLKLLPTAPGRPLNGPWSVTLEKRHLDHRGRVPKILFWSGAMFLLSFSLSLFVGTFNDDPWDVRVLWIFPMLVMVVMMGKSALALHDHIEALTPITVQLDGAGITHRWSGARPRDIRFDGKTLVEVCVPQGSEGRALSPDSVTGYTFKKGKVTSRLHQDAGFDHDDLVRIWPDVLAAARRNGTMAGPELERIARAAEEDGGRTAGAAASQTGRTPLRIDDQ